MPKIDIFKMAFVHSWGLNQRTFQIPMKTEGGVGFRNLCTQKMQSIFQVSKIKIASDPENI